MKLFDEMCDGCRYRMSGKDKGCIKFSHTSVEINAGVYVTYRSGFGEKLSFENMCKSYERKE